MSNQQNDEILDAIGEVFTDLTPAQQVEISQLIAAGELQTAKDKANWYAEVSPDDYLAALGEDDDALSQD